MKHPFTRALPIFLLFYSGALVAQESPVSGGGDTSAPGVGSVSFSYGQVVYITSGSAETSAQGVQQPFEISVVTGIETVGIQLEINAFPNPTHESLTIQVDYLPMGALWYRLHDAAGRLLERNALNQGTTTLQVGEMPPGAYFLTVGDASTELKQFKIIKN